MFVDPRDNNGHNRNTFSWYLPIDTTNNHICMALLNTILTQDVQVAGIGMTKTSYII
jgi:hypothetical protein